MKAVILEEEACNIDIGNDRYVTMLRDDDGNLSIVVWDENTNPVDTFYHNFTEK